MNLLTTMKHFGYELNQLEGALKTFDSRNAAGYIRQNKPVFMYGFDSILEKYYMWIIDGYAIPHDKEFNDNVFYLHCVWGNGGRNDGYYHYDDKYEGIGPDHRYKNLIMAAAFKHK